MNKGKSRTIIKALFIFALLAAGAIRIIDGDAASGTSFLAATLGVVAVATILQQRRSRQAKETDTVLYDERDEIRAGKAALFTVRVLLFVLTIMMLVIFAVGLDWKIPMLVPVGFILFAASFLLRVSYWAMNRD